MVWNPEPFKDTIVVVTTNSWVFVPSWTNNNANNNNNNPSTMFGTAAQPTFVQPSFPQTTSTGFSTSFGGGNTFGFQPASSTGAAAAPMGTSGFGMAAPSSTFTTTSSTATPVSNSFGWSSSSQQQQQPQNTQPGNNPPMVFGSSSSVVPTATMQDDSNFGNRGNTGSTGFQWNAPTGFGGRVGDNQPGRTPFGPSTGTMPTVAPAPSFTPFGSGSTNQSAPLVFGSSTSMAHPQSDDDMGDGDYGNQLPQQDMSDAGGKVSPFPADKSMSPTPDIVSTKQEELNRLKANLEAKKKRLLERKRQRETNSSSPKPLGFKTGASSGTQSNTFSQLPKDLQQHATAIAQGG